MGMVRIPLGSLFHGIPLEIMRRYRSVETFADIGHNTTDNRMLKDIARKAGVKKNLHYHLARHTCATLLNLYGLKMQEIQQILGHARMETTSQIVKQAPYIINPVILCFIVYIYPFRY